MCVLWQKTSNVNNQFDTLAQKYCFKKVKEKCFPKKKKSGTSTLSVPLLPRPQQ